VAPIARGLGGGRRRSGGRGTGVDVSFLGLRGTIAGLAAVDKVGDKHLFAWESNGGDRATEDRTPFSVAFVGLGKNAAQSGALTSWN
jgi:hypothetical protein